MREVGREQSPRGRFCSPSPVYGERGPGARASLDHRRPGGESASSAVRRWPAMGVLSECPCARRALSP